MFKTLFYTLVPFFVTFISAQDSLIQIVPSSYRLGNISDQQPVKCHFTIENKAARDVEILKVDAVCGCNVTSLETKQIAAGQKSKLEITFNPWGRSGYLRWEVLVYHTLSTEPVKASFDVTVLKDHYLSHSSLYLGEFQQGQPKEAKVWISLRDFPTLQIHKAEVELTNKQNSFDVSWHSEMYTGFYPETRPAYCVLVRAKKKIAFGPIEGKLLVYTNHPAKPVIEIPLSGKVSGEIGLNRNYLSMGLVKRNQSTTKSFLVYAVDESKAFTVTKVTSTLPFITLEVKTLFPERYYEIFATAQADDKSLPGEFRGEIQISTSSTTQPLVRLPVQAILMK